jgi:hypothetical protein
MAVFIEKMGILTAKRPSFTRHEAGRARKITPVYKNEPEF